MNPADQTSSWKGYENLEYLFIFGASTSDVGYRHGTSPQPTKERPLGVEYPGTTWTEQNEANWVGHLINQYTHSNPVVYNYAVGGHTLKGYAQQILRGFLDGPGQEDSGVGWTAENSLFLSSIGGNDLADANLDIVSCMTEIFELQYKLYEGGARNFVIFNVAPLPPPKGDIPEFTQHMLSKREEKCGEWNVMLPPFIDDFTAAYPDSTMFLFDLYSHTKKMQEDPTAYGFSENAGTMYDGEMYVDNLHPTSKAHKHFAWHLGSFLSGKEMDKDREEKYDT
ncbi:hypothetical protein FRC04_000833 [Tulasnella sp. 424]|nr:hypothetical protein FRC04_000833 [Tulasnella sp. 424]